MILKSNMYIRKHLKFYMTISHMYLKWKHSDIFETILVIIFILSHLNVYFDKYNAFSIQNLIVCNKIKLDVWFCYIEEMKILLCTLENQFQINFLIYVDKIPAIWY